MVRKSTSMRGYMVVVNTEEGFENLAAGLCVLTLKSNVS